VPYRQNGDQEIARIEVHDIEDREALNPDKEHDCGHIRGGRVDYKA
jgi:hypothetical protein